MISLGDPVLSNPLLAALQIGQDDKIISIKETTNADSNFIITHLMKQIFYEKNRLCLVILHNTVEHYQNIGKKLGYDLLKGVVDGSVRIIEPMKDLVNNIDQEDTYSQENTENVVKQLYIDIKESLIELTDNQSKVYLIIDDLSHLQDLGLQIKDTLRFLHYCITFIDKESVSVVFNNHVSTKANEIISNNLEYVADVHVKVSSLKTGLSQDVTGFLSISRKLSVSNYHYKAFDRGIKTFHPGESIYHLYK